MLLQLTKRFASRIVAVYMLMLIEMVFYMLRPILIGRAIESLLSQEGLSMAIMYVIANEAGYAGLSGIRQFVDTRVFMRMINETQIAMTEYGLATGQDTSTMQGRVELSRELVRLFEYTIPKLIQASCILVSSMVLLATYSWLVFLINAAMWLVALVVIPATAKRVSRYAEEQHNAIEQDTAVFVTRDLAVIKNHLLRYMNIAVKWSDTQAVSFTIIDGIGAVVVFVSIGLVCLISGSFAAAFAVHRYSANVAGGLQDINNLLQDWQKAKDVWNRCSRV